MTIFNIGLVNNPMDQAEIVTMLNLLAGDIPVHKYLAEGVYKSDVEPTLVVVYDDENIGDTELETLTQWMTQECIALKRNGVGRLIFNPNYTGDRFEFNDDYFIG